MFSVFLAAELVSAAELTLADGALALVAASASLFAMRLFLNHTVFRGGDQAPVPLWGVASLGLLMGAATVAPFMVVLHLAGEDLLETPIPGLLTGGVLRTVMLFPIAVYLLGLRHWYVTARRSAERDLVAAEAARMEASDHVDATRALIIEAARREIGPSRREASALLEAAVRSEAPDDISLAAASLRTTARSAVRSASHHLWVNSGRIATIRWRSIVPAALIRYPLPLLLPTLTIISATVIRTQRGLPPGPSALLMAAAVVATISAVYLTGRALIARLPAAALWVTTVAVIAAPLLSTVVASGVSDRARGLGLATTAGVTLVAALFTIASSVVLMVRDSGAAVVQALVDDRVRADAQQAALELMNQRLSRDLAFHLHGTLQPQLMAASMALDGVVESNDPQAIADAVAQAEDALGMEVRSPEPEPATALDDLIARLIDRWDAILPVAVQADGVGDDLLPPGVARALDECLNNAVIHGCATGVEVHIARGRDGWDIEVADDGEGPGGGRPGLGSAALDEITGGAWSITAGERGGTVVQAHVPSRAPAAGV